MDCLHAYQIAQVCQNRFLNILNRITCNEEGHTVKPMTILEIIIFIQTIIQHC